MHAHLGSFNIVVLEWVERASTAAHCGGDIHQHNEHLCQHVREAPLKFALHLFGHCPNSNCTPPHSNKHSGTNFQALIYQFERLYVFVNGKVCILVSNTCIKSASFNILCSTPSWQRFRPPPPKIKQMSI